VVEGLGGDLASVIDPHQAGHMAGLGRAQGAGRGQIGLPGCLGGRKQGSQRVIRS